VILCMIFEEYLTFSDYFYFVVTECCICNRFTHDNEGVISEGAVWAHRDGGSMLVSEN
jgi:hypothetical protein